MKDEQLDIIMKNYIKDENHPIDVETKVMSRIMSFEEKKSMRLIYLEYGLSALVFCLGIASVFIIQYLFFLYRSYFEDYWNLIHVTSWIVTGIFIIITFSSFYILNITRLLRQEKKIIEPVI